MARGKQSARKRFSMNAQRTRAAFTYNDAQKAADPLKDAANDVLCAMTRDLQAYYRRAGRGGQEQVDDMRYLVLDGTEMASTRALVRQCGVRAENVYVCSREVEFRGRCRRKYNTHTGELSDFIVRMQCTRELMDVVYLDFCGQLVGENMHAMRLLFERRLLEPTCVLAFTVAYKRVRSGSAYLRQHAVEPLDALRDLARTHQYTVRTTYVLRNSRHGMITYFCKLLNAAEAEGADDWAHTDVLGAVLRILETSG